MAEVPVPRDLFRKILRLIDDLRLKPAPFEAEDIHGEEKATREVRLDGGKWANGLPRAGRFPKKCHRMAAKGIQFLWWCGSGTISTKLDGICEMSVDWP